MNTRLQVEHPVTELITGLDLVAWQLRIAAGEPLPLRQEQVTLNGHAMEVRLYAEDPAQGFMPQTGDILRWQPPAHVRVDHGVVEGQAVSPFYDPMLAKIIAHGATREEARRRLLRAVQDCVLLGVNSNQALLAELLNHPQFAGGDFGTGFIGEHFSEIAAHTPGDETLAIAAELFYQQGAAAHSPALAGWRNTASAPWTCQLAVRDEVRSVTRDATLQVETDGQYITVIAHGVRRRLAYHLDGTLLWLPGVRIENRTHAAVHRQVCASTGTVAAPMDGAIVGVHVREGDTVSQGQLLLVLEAMKMEHPLKAGLSGVVKRVQVSAGDQVKSRQILLQIE